MRNQTLAVFMSLGLGGSAMGNTALQWNFNSPVDDGSALTGTMDPNINLTGFTPSITGIGGVELGLTVGDLSLPSFPQDLSSDPKDKDNDTALRTNFYPAQGTANRSAGIEIQINASYIKDIEFSFDKRVNSSASRYLRVQYSTNGGATWVDSSLLDTRTTGVSYPSLGNPGPYYNQYARAVDHPSLNFDFGVLDGVADARIRLVTEFAPSTLAYEGNISNLATGGSPNYVGGENPFIRYDMITIDASLLGDFNDVPGSRTLALFEQRATLARKPDEGRFTFPAPQPAREIDFIFSAPDNAFRAREVQVIDERVASDHRPVLAVLSVGSSRR